MYEFRLSPRSLVLRGVTRLQNLLRRLKGSEFRTFVHSPQRMRAVLEATGLVHAAQDGNIAWTLDLYRRLEAA